MGNYIGNNYGDCIQNYYGGPKPTRPKSTVDKIGILGGLLVAIGLILIDALWMYGKWAGFLAAPLLPGDVKRHFVETFPLFWTVLTGALCYCYSNSRIYR